MSIPNLFRTFKSKTPKTPIKILDKTFLKREGYIFLANVVNLRDFPCKSPFAKGGFRGILIGYINPPSPPLRKGGDLGLS